MKIYVVTYLSQYGLHERFRCSAKSKKAARKECVECMGYLCVEVISVEEEK